MRKHTSILSEGQLAEVSEAMRLVSSADRHLDRTVGALQHCRVSVDADSFKNAQYYLDELHSKLAAVPLTHCEALLGKRSRTDGTELRHSAAHGKNPCMRFSCATECRPTKRKLSLSTNCRAMTDAYRLPQAMPLGGL